ncbi:hypothetical protein Tco_0903746 [Tanacetum coccineum]
MLNIGTDKAKIIRKRSKTGKHEHGNERAHKEMGKNYQKSNPSQTSVNLVNQSQGHKKTKISKVTKPVKLGGRNSFTVHLLPQFNLSVKSWGKSQLKDKKDNSGVKVHLGSNKRHSQALIGQYPSRYATQASKEAQGKGYFALILHSEETQEATNYGLPR